MKTIVISILILAINFAAQAGEQKKEVSIYSAETIKELRIDSLSSLIKSHFNSNKLKIQTVDTILYLVNGKSIEMTTKEKDSSLLAATSVEVLKNNNALIINAIL